MNPSVLIFVLKLMAHVKYFQEHFNCVQPPLNTYLTEQIIGMNHLFQLLHSSEYSFMNIILMITGAAFVVGHSRPCKNSCL